MHKKIEEIKKNESKPKVLKNIDIANFFKIFKKIKKFIKKLNFESIL